MALGEEKVLEIWKTAYFKAVTDARKAGLSEEDAKWAGIDAAEEATRVAGLAEATEKA